MIYSKKVNISGESKLEFIAKTVADLGKGILIVAFASYFFEKYSMIMRISICIIGISLIFSGLALYPKIKGE